MVAHALIGAFFRISLTHGLNGWQFGTTSARFGTTMLTPYIMALITPAWLIFTSPCEMAWIEEPAYTYDLDDCTSIERVGYSGQAAWDAALKCDNIE